MTTKTKNPFTWLELYVEDMKRAQKFYETILDIKMEPLPMPVDMGDMEMVSFPWAEGEANISGALVKTSMIKPGAGGTLAYFACDDCSVEESRVEAAGGSIIQPKMSLGNHGFCSLVTDTEGNTIGFHSMK